MLDFFLGISPFVLDTNDKLEVIMLVNKLHIYNTKQQKILKIDVVQPNAYSLIKLN